MKKNFKNNLNEINENIREAELLLKETMSFYEDETSDDDIDDTFDYNAEVDNIEPTENINQPTETNFISNIRKQCLNGLSALCDYPENEEYQILKKIFQMCDKKAEKKDNITEHRLFGILKDNKEVLFETTVTNVKEFENLKQALIKESIERGYKPSQIKLVSENKIIC